MILNMDMEMESNFRTFDMDMGVATVSTPSGGTDDYNALVNKPSINNVELQGNKGGKELGLAPLDENDNIIIDGEVRASNTPYIIKRTVLLTIPQETIKEAIENDTKIIPIEPFTIDTDLIVYASYGGVDYADSERSNTVIQWFVANPYVTDGFACIIYLNGENSEFQWRVLDKTNITDLVVYQVETKFLSNFYLPHDMQIINSISMNRRGAIAPYSTALGMACKVTGDYGFANGFANEATGIYGTALGMGTFATGLGGLSSGQGTTAGNMAFATGRMASATGQASAAFGRSTSAKAANSIAEGQNTIASSQNQHVQGRFNIEDSSNKYAQIIGNGTNNNNRKNAHTVSWNGEAWYAGDVYVGSTGGKNRDDGSKKLITADEVPVQSINGKTGAVTLSASDVGALPDDTILPVANDATLTIQENGVSIGSFSANASEDKTVNITVPTNTSDLQNDSGYITSDDIPVTSVNTKTGAVTLNAQDVGAVPIGGGQLLGALIAQSNNNYTVAQMRNIIFSTKKPRDTEGNDGDICIIYKE